MLTDIDAGDAIVRDLGRLSQQRGNLAQVTPLEVQRAIKLVAASAPARWRDQTIVALLRALSVKHRAACVHLIDGASDSWTAKAIVRSIGDAKLKRSAAGLIAVAGKRVPHDHFVVLSDVDDTVKPWKDTSASGPVYPGALALYEVLAPRGDVHFVTARDGVALGVGGDLRATGIRYGSVAYGSSYSGVLALLGSHRPMIERKIANLTALIEKNPGDQIILVGDSGQADAAVFARVLETHGDRVAVAMLHEIPGYPADERFAESDKALVFADFADAAEQLCARQLITAAERDRVATAR